MFENNIEFLKHAVENRDFILPVSEHHLPDGTVWIGTDGGLTRYDKESDSFYTYGMERGYSVKAITEDKRGYLYIGTWRNGLMRLHPDRKTFDHYPRLNYMNSAYSLLLDSKQRLWIGTGSSTILYTMLKSLPVLL